MSKLVNPYLHCLSTKKKVFSVGRLGFVSTLYLQKPKHVFGIEQVLSLRI